ncbi:hypothetical protein niasHT_031655 [Heterodera trifolii]|uniref:Uncharacterized protein n=1 Tax=Heterodera trifolii TaxID=157864 RepID=A0ABD2J3G5_9BILA
MVDDPNCYPKWFPDREAFMFFAEAFFLEQHDTFDQYIARRLGPTDWAANADAFLAAILLQRQLLWLYLCTCVGRCEKRSITLTPGTGICWRSFFPTASDW